MARQHLPIAAALAVLAAVAPIPATAADPTGLPPAAAPVDNPFSTTTGLMRCLADQGVVLTSGHRGGPAPGYPENAIETAAHTLSQAPVLIEMDERTTRDGVLVFMHDDTLGRTSTGEGKVSDHTLAELQALRLEDDDGRATDFVIPTLPATLEAMRGRGILVIDVKEDAAIPAIVAAVQAADARDYVLVNLYRPSQAMTLHRIDPTISLVHPVSNLADLVVLERLGVNLDNVSAWVGIDGYDPRDPALWAALRARGMPIMFATLFFADRAVAGGDHDIYGELADLGVNVIPTDHHLEAFAALEARRAAAEGLRACGSLGAP
jgi:glycerophosphoryl diester phosphodiesterase